MEHTLIVRINPVAEINAVVVSVSHNSNRKIVMAAYYPALDEGKINPTLVITAGKYKTIEPMPRLNRKKIDAHFEAAKQQIKDKSGIYYDGLVEFLAEKGYTLAAD